MRPGRDPGKNMQKKLVLGILLMAIGSVFKFMSDYLPKGTLSNIGTGFFPDVLATGLMICALIIIFKK